jgi:hypothetical protein
MPVHIGIKLLSDREQKRSPVRHDGSNTEPAGWSKHREPLIEAPAKSLSLNPGKWTSQATARSGPAYAPGCGIRKSS